MNIRYYINLTAGLEHLFNKNLEVDNVVFIHILSSHIEQKAWNKFFYLLPDDLLLHLALGYCCIILDSSSNRKGISKVIKIGIPVMKFVLNKIWFDKLCYKDKRIDKDYLMQIYKKLGQDTKQKLRYYKRFLRNDEIYLEGKGMFLLKEDCEDIIKKFLKVYR